MNLQGFLRNYAQRTGNSFLEYTDTIDVITISLEGGRFQNVACYMIHRDGLHLVEFMSKVCPSDTYLDYKSLLELNQNLCYAKIVLHNDLIQVAATVRQEYASEQELITMMEEVARVADNLEFEFTGQDAN